jgi:hypothetical protein
MMKLSTEAIIATTKLTEYLLVWKPENDKSQWLEKAGYTVDNWQQLENDLRIQILPLDLTYIETTRFGQLYQIIGIINSPNGRELSVRTIWMIEHESGLTKFITMYPNKD